VRIEVAPQIETRRQEIDLQRQFRFAPPRLPPPGFIASQQIWLPDFRLGSKAEVMAGPDDVRFAPTGDILSELTEPPDPDFPCLLAGGAEGTG
jgi:hypothetical protein